MEKAAENSEMDRFESALRQIVSTSKEELKRLQEKDRATKSDRPKRGPKRSTMGENNS